ncbi:DUF2076 domain-containing protein [Pseudomonas sp. RA_35y_Pfl2_P32]|uniref:DUF2076 domain-containing protein n=1 Tax=Pseudomonas sp. RA_35y_Pfl2_P32 TaxID=3088705 RepID=UPI0030DC2190
MNSEEQTLIDDLFARLQQAHTQAAPRDAQAENRINEHLGRQPAAGYFMTQAILVQEAALKRLDEQNQALAKQVQHLQNQLSQTPTAAQSGAGGFLSSLFGGPREPQPAAPQAPSAFGGNGWREPGRSAPKAQPGAQNFTAPAQQAPAAGGSFLGGALKTAAGVAGGVMLAQGISSLFHSNQAPQEVVEVIKEEPAPVNDTGNGWGDAPRMAGNDSYGNDQGGFADADYSDDDSFV